MSAFFVIKWVGLQCSTGVRQYVTSNCKSATGSDEVSEGNVVNFVRYCENARVSSPYITLQ